MIVPLASVNSAAEHYKPTCKENGMLQYKGETGIETVIFTVEYIVLKRYAIW